MNKCTICNKEFEARKSLQGHVSKLHGGQGMPDQAEDVFPCTICGAEYGSKSGLYGHTKKHHNDPPPPAPKQETVRDILLELLNHQDIPVEVRLQFALRILNLTE